MRLSEFFENFEPKTDKGTSHSYIQNYYCEEFSSKKELDIKLLEIGIRNGFSHYLWDKFFINGTIYGVDNGESGFEYEKLFKDTRVHYFIDDGYSKSFLSRFEDNYFDYVIDDASHSVESQIKAIEVFLPKIKSNGKLIIEDIQALEFCGRLKTAALNNPLVAEFKIHDFRLKSKREDDLLIEIVKK